MQLKAKVVEVISGSQFRDGKQRIKLNFELADTMYKSLIVINDSNLSLDDDVFFAGFAKMPLVELFETVSADKL